MAIQVRPGSFIIIYCIVIYYTLPKIDAFHLQGLYLKRLGV